MPTDRPTFEALKDFLAETSPILVKARDSLHEEGKMLVEADDRIYVIEGRSECPVWKGQNQRTFEISFFPRKIVEDLSGRRNPEISRPLKNSFIHTGHGSHQGKNWGKPEYIDEVYLRNPMNPADASGSSPEAGELGMRLQNRKSMRGVHPDQREEKGQERKAPLRPAPVPGQNVRPPSIKSMPNLKAEASQHVKEDSLIDLSNDERMYYNTGSHAVSSSNLLDNSLSDQLSVNESGADRSYQNEDFEYNQPQAETDSFNTSATSRHNQYMNQFVAEAEAVNHQHQDSHDTSFGSLAPGETYHYPPEDDDPFDTSNVNIPNLNSTPRSEIRLESSLSQMRISQAGGAGPPSIISQLLASQPSSQSSSPQPPGLTPPPARRVTASEPRHLHPVLDPRHRRAVSTMSEAETFLPPLTSPFSPPAFNPYDIVLGSNEAIAGLESPAPFGKSKRDQAFSWLDDKIGNLKAAKSSQNLSDRTVGRGSGGGVGDVFQFPCAPDNDNDDDLLRQQEMERQKEIERQHEINQQRELERQQELNIQKELERQQELNRQRELERQQELIKQQEINQQQQQELVRQQLIKQQEEIQKQEQLEMARQMEMARQQLEIQKNQELERQQIEAQQREAERQRELQQRQEMVRQQEFLARQQRENELSQQNMQLLMQKQMIQQAEQEKRRRYEQQQQQQQQLFSEQHKQQELQRKNLQKIMNFKKSSMASAPGASQDVFHFPQTSSLSTSGQELPPYSVDKDFIKDLEKSLGENEAVANMLGPQPPPTPSVKVSNIPSLQPPPSNPTARTSPGQGGARPRSSPRQEAAARPTSRSSGGRPVSRGSCRQEEEAEVRTATVKPFKHQAESGGKMGDVLGAASGWRSLNMQRGAGRVDLLASQRTQLDRFTGAPEQSETYGTTRVTTSNAVEINKIAQCSKMVPGMSGTEIRAALEAVNWDTSVAVKNLKIDKLFRIGVATKPKCEKVLQAVSWDLERAASKLLDSL